jgi:integrase
MWAEELESGKIKFVERYTNPLTGKYGRVSVVMEKNTASTRKVALEALNAKIQGKLEAINAEPEQKGLTLGKLKELYLAYQKKAFKLSTYRRNYYNLKTTINCLGADILVSSLSAGYIKQKMDTLDLENGSYNEYITRFKAMLRWGYENDLVADIRYLDKLKKLQNDTRREKLVNKYLEREELSTLLKEMSSERWELLTEFLVLSGLRYGEVCGLDKSDVSQPEQMIHVTKNYDCNNRVLTSTKTFTSTRDVFIQPELADVCKRIDAFFDTAGMRKSSKLFFPDFDGGYMHYYDYAKYLREVSKRVIGREITPHILRHTHVSLLAESGVPLETISRRLGHSGSKVTKEVYLHVTKRLEERDRERISNTSLL